MTIPNYIKNPQQFQIIQFIDGEWRAVDGYGGGGTVGPVPSDLTPEITDPDAGQPGISLKYSREDHKHQAETDVAVSIGPNNSEGLSNKYSRSDHTHRVVDLHITGQSAGDMLYFDGINWVVRHIGADGQVLTSETGLPIWATPDPTPLPSGLLGQFLYVADDSNLTFNPETPVISDDGFILTNDQDNIVVI